MIHAYNKVYLGDVMQNLGGFFDIAINAMNYDPDDIALKFSSSPIASAIENGNPDYLSGKSATEMLSLVLECDVPYTQTPIDRSPEFWAGWVLAYAQWYLDKPFNEIFSVIPFNTLISLYTPYHEAPESKTAEKIKSLFPNISKLKSIRKSRRLSQKQLADLSGVTIRTIQSYEQGDVDIRKAQTETLLALAKVLDCTIEELLK